MVPILSLWLPIVVSAVFVFLASSVLHIVLSYHYSDFKRLPDQDAAKEAVKGLKLEPGDYSYPHAANSGEMKSSDFQERQKAGPMFMLTVLPQEAANMGASLAKWFVYTIIVGVFAAYVAGRALDPGAHYLSVFRFVGATAFFCYTVAGWGRGIWFHEPLKVTAKNTFDGLIYALLTAGTFGWLWPDA